MARRIEQVEDAILELERHHRSDDGDAAIALNAHPIRPRAATLALGAHIARKLNGTTGPQQALGQRGLARIRVGDDGEGATTRNFGGSVGAHGGGYSRTGGAIEARLPSITSSLRQT